MKFRLFAMVLLVCGMSAILFLAVEIGGYNAPPHAEAKPYDLDPSLKADEVVTKLPTHEAQEQWCLDHAWTLPVNVEVPYCNGMAVGLAIEYLKEHPIKQPPESSELVFGNCHNGECNAGVEVKPDGKLVPGTYAYDRSHGVRCSADDAVCKQVYNLLDLLENKPAEYPDHQAAD